MNDNPYKSGERIGRDSPQERTMPETGYMFELSRSALVNPAARREADRLGSKTSHHNVRWAMEYLLGMDDG